MSNPHARTAEFVNARMAHLGLTITAVSERTRKGRTKREGASTRTISRLLNPNTKDLENGWRPHKATMGAISRALGWEGDTIERIWTDPTYEPPGDADDWLGAPVQRLRNVEEQNWEQQARLADLERQVRRIAGWVTSAPDLDLSGTSGPG